MRHTFGIELEFRDALFGEVKRDLEKARLDRPFKCSMATDRQIRSNGACWHLKYDHSVSEVYNRQRSGGELASPAFTASRKNFDEIRKCHAILNTHNPTYDRETGIHVHVSMKDVDRLKFILSWFRFEHLFYNLFSERRRCDYAKTLYTINRQSLQRPLCEKLKTLAEKSRYSVIFGDHQDVLYFYKRNKVDFVEIRLGQMCNDSDILIGWIKICLQLIRYSKGILDSLSFLTNESGPIKLNDLNRNQPRSLSLTRREMLRLKKRMEPMPCGKN